MIPPIKGRLADRKNATIELIDNKITIITSAGFFGGRSENKAIDLGDVTSVEHGTGVKPYPEAMMIKVMHTDSELSFFSINMAPLEELATHAEEYVEKRTRLLAEMKEEFTLDRGAHVALLYLNLELLDALMELIIRLHGSVDWESVEAQFTQVERVNQDRDNLTHMRPSHLSLERLAQGVTERDSDIIKAEVYDLVSLLHQICAEKAKHSEAWFKTQLHLLFTEALMTLWSRELAEITGENLSEDSETVDRRFHELRRIVAQDTGDEGLEEIDPVNLQASRLQLFEWIVKLETVEFDPGEELERRLAA